MAIRQISAFCYLFLSYPFHKNHNLNTSAELDPGLHLHIIRQLEVVFP